MSRLGIVMLVHESLDRAAEVARHWTAHGCPVVIHLDTAAGPAAQAKLAASLAGDPLIRFSARHRCEWGTWGIVAASQAAAALLLETFPEAGHVYLTSGSCLPLRPAADLEDFLAARPGTDFIESVTTEEVPWTQGGLDIERFTLRFPFSWKRRRALFDGYVALQRKAGLRRRIPAGLEPHLGSQWWCLTRATLEAILTSPDRKAHERYFSRVWIPDESYFQTLARRFSGRIESRSLTLSKFDHQGKPHMFYDDHLGLLQHSDCFAARKIWPRADRLYAAFLGGSADRGRPAADPGRIDRVFAKAAERRTQGRAGLYMQSRFPRQSVRKGITAAPYSVLQGFGGLFQDFDTWLARVSGARVHGHLLAPGRAAFAGGEDTAHGGLSASAALRDDNPESFLSNLIWNTRGEHQCFQFSPADSQALNWMMARDPNARISVISGAWAVPLFRAGGKFPAMRKEAARLQRIEAEQLKLLRSQHANARVHVWTLGDFVEAPRAPLQEVLAGIIGADPLPRRARLPQMVGLDGFAEFLQRLRNQGMHPYLMGDFPAGPDPVNLAAAPRKSQAEG